MRIGRGIVLTVAALAVSSPGRPAAAGPRSRVQVGGWGIPTGEFHGFLAERTGPCQGRTSAFAADLVLTSTPWPSRIQIGGVLSYTLTVSNAGPQAAGSVTLRQNIPFMFFPGYTQVTSSQGFCEQNGYNIVCGLGTLPAGSSATVDVSATATFAGTSTSRAEVWPSEPQGADNNTLVFTIRTVDCPAQGFCQ